MVIVLYANMAYNTIKRMWLRLSNSIRYSMFYSKKLLEKIDALKEEKGFSHRSQAIIYLINLGFEQLQEKNKNK